MSAPVRRRLQPIVVETVGAPVCVESFARLLLAVRAKHAKPLELVRHDEQPSSALPTELEGPQRRLD